VWWYSCRCRCSLLLLYRWRRLYLLILLILFVLSAQCCVLSAFWSAISSVVCTAYAAPLPHRRQCTARQIHLQSNNSITILYRAIQKKFHFPQSMIKNLKKKFFWKYLFPPGGIELVPLLEKPIFYQLSYNTDLLIFQKYWSSYISKFLFRSCKNLNKCSSPYGIELATTLHVY